MSQVMTLNHARAGSGALSAPLDYGTTARQMLSTAGFVEPVGCREVFNFDAASLRDPEAAEAQVQLQYLASTSDARTVPEGRGTGFARPDSLRRPVTVWRCSSLSLGTNIL